VHNVSQWPNLRQLGEPLGKDEGLLEASSSLLPVTHAGTDIQQLR